MAKKKPTPHPSIVAFGTNLREIRLAHGFTQAHLAKVAGISIAYVSLLERAGRNPPLRQVAVLAEALNVSTADLVREAA